MFGIDTTSVRLQPEIILLFGKGSPWINQHTMTAGNTSVLFCLTINLAPCSAQHGFTFRPV
jgi:hypothetical protein